MNILLVHQNFPGQFLHLARYLRALPNIKVMGIGEKANIQKRGTIGGIMTLGYKTPLGAGEKTHPYLQFSEASVRRGQAVARGLLHMKQKGFVPDVILAHPGWGEALFVRDIFPDTPLVLFCEFFFYPREADMAFDPEYPCSFEQQISVKIRNSVQIASIMEANALVSPTNWQASRYPKLFQPFIHIIHEGVDTRLVTPEGEASISLVQGENGDCTVLEPGVAGQGLADSKPDGPVLTLGRGQKVLTYIARNLEPYRGFHQFIRALPAIQAKHPDMHTLIVGGDEVSYSLHLPAGQTYKQLILEPIQDSLDLSRVHFTGRVSYDVLLSIYRISSAHVYMTYPFVLSWSLLEIMAAGGLVIGSRTPPVEEVVRHGENGLLVDFFDRDALVDTVDEVLRQPEKFGPLRHAARQTIVTRYEQRECLEKQVALLASVCENNLPPIGIAG